MVGFGSPYKEVPKSYIVLVLVLAYNGIFNMVPLDFIIEPYCSLKALCLIYGLLLLETDGVCNVRINGVCLFACLSTCTNSRIAGHVQLTITCKRVLQEALQAVNFRQGVN